MTGGPLHSLSSSFPRPPCPARDELFKPFRPSKMINHPGAIGEPVRMVCSHHSMIIVPRITATSISYLYYQWPIDYAISILRVGAGGDFINRAGY